MLLKLCLLLRHAVSGKGGANKSPAVLPMDRLGSRKLRVELADLMFSDLSRSHEGAVEPSKSYSQSPEGRE